MVTFVSYGFEGYKIGFNYHFYRTAKLTFGVPIACKKHGLNYNNNAIERHNEDFKQRSNVMRGFKSKDSGSAFTELRRIVYNFVRTHMGLSKTPADEAELKMPLDTNRLLNLISLSTSPLTLPYSAPYVVEDAFKNPMCYGF